ncbi:MAG TPA: MlaD family protein [Pseudonocardiaceae bacterium]|jgi:phospholipid/cholesterol/gamma-HCH transport system substrate-binding protein|nr:MlaD family protein [Pseudonocardiaceae bacterium]
MTAVHAIRRRFRSRVITGAVLLVLVVTALFAVYQKEAISTALSSGSTVNAEFARDYRLVPNKTEVKMAGVVIGTVTDVQPDSQGNVIVSMKVHDDVPGKLGSAPSALIRPTTLLGGNYYVQLTPGGTHQQFDGSTIPLNRTNIPVELDQVLAAIPGSARTSIQNTLNLTNQALSNGAGAAVGNVLRDAPGTLAPANAVLSGLEGTRPGQDLSQLVPDLDSMAAVMSEHDGQLGSVVDSLNSVSGALSNSRAPLAEAIGSLPQTLSATRTGMVSLQGTLNQLTSTANAALPAAQQLGPLLSAANPVIAAARPLVDNLRPVLDQALPIVSQLTPTAQLATTTLNDISGPVLDRVNGPIAKMVLSPWSGSGYYAGDGGNGHLFYQEVGYLAAHTASLSQYGDKNGRMLGLGLGVGVSSVGGNDIGTAQLLQSLGLLPADGLALLPSSGAGGNGWTGESASAPGQGSVLTAPLAPVNAPPGQGDITSGLGALLGLGNPQGK